MAINYTSARKSILSTVLSKEGGFKLEEFVAEIQGFCLGLRLEHWETTSYELHKAVESTQATMEDKLDDFVEACIGMYGGSRPVLKKTIEATTDENHIITCLKGVDLKDSSLLNIRDEMLQAVYRYKYLKTLK